jgi:hypothetical protein
MRTSVGYDSPSGALKRDKGLKADEYVELGIERMIKMVYRGVEMWRLAAVGYKR